MSISQNKAEIEALELAVGEIDYLFQEGVIFSPEDQEKIMAMGTELQNIVTSIQLMKEVMARHQEIKQ